MKPLVLCIVIVFIGGPLRIGIAQEKPPETGPEAGNGDSADASRENSPSPHPGAEPNGEEETTQEGSPLDGVSVEKQRPEDLESQVQQALARFAREPSLRELEQAALRFADVHHSPTERWHRASRVSAVMPTFRVSADYGVGRDESLDRYQDEPDRWGADTDRGYGIAVSAQWKLDELIFNTDELKVFDALADRALRRESLLSVLIGYYYERRRLQLETVLTPASDSVAFLDRRLRIEELTAAIDALTGGLLSRKLGVGR